MSQIVLNLTIPTSGDGSLAAPATVSMNGENIMTMLESIRETINNINSMMEKYVTHQVNSVQTDVCQEVPEPAAVVAQEVLEPAAVAQEVPEPVAVAQEVPCDDEEVEVEETDIVEVEEEEAQEEEEEDAQEEEEDAAEQEEEEAQEEEAEEEAALEEFEFSGKTYYKDEENFVYVLDAEGELVDEPVGVWNEKRQIVQFYKK